MMCISRSNLMLSNFYSLVRLCSQNRDADGEDDAVIVGPSVLELEYLNHLLVLFGISVKSPPNNSCQHHCHLKVVTTLYPTTRSQEATMPIANATTQWPIASQPLTQSSFAPYGDVIENPIVHDVNSIPSDLPSSPVPFILANQNTALKASPVSSMQNRYHESHTNRVGKPVMSMFACFPRALDVDGAGKSIFRVRIMERHPFTTQTFIPMGLSPDDISTKYLVIVAPTLQAEQQHRQQGPPDIQNLRAFIAHGRQAVTYGAGTWHAPMVVVGKKRIDFVVVQFVNGVSGDDCQEVEIEQKGASVSVTLNERLTTKAAKL